MPAQPTLSAANPLNHLGKTNTMKNLYLPLPRAAVLALLALSLGGSLAQAQTDKQPWQGTFTKSLHVVGASRIFIDLPVPPPSRLLTLERVGVTLGPTLSIYGKMVSCEIESSHPRSPVHELAENRTRVLLPLPAQIGTSRTWAVFHAPIRLYVEGNDTAFRQVFRVSCDVDAIAASDVFTVTAVGYTTPK